MQDRAAPVSAAIDIGSNTIHIVVARCFSDDLDILADEEELVRIGESVSATGMISAQKLAATLTTLEQYKALAEQHHATAILVVATEAIRRATNREEFCATIRRETGLEVHLIGGDVEATLTFYGATYERMKANNGASRIGVMDLGGGSTEFVLAKGKQITWHTSLSLGSGWVHDRYFSSNPPTYEDWVVARTFLRTYFQGFRMKRPPILVATGGTANSLLSLTCRAFHLDEQRMYVTLNDVLRCEGLLLALSADEIASRYQIAAKRAQILPAGALIIRSILECLHLDELYISRHGIREGMLLAYALYGDDWLKQVARAARSEQQSQKAFGPDQSEEVFIQTGRRMLQERLHTMLAWREEVLKHEDIEAVHKMRVASRRLRAVLDAYQTVSEPRSFKKVYRHVKKLADTLGKARDTDVMIERLRSSQEQMPTANQAGVQWLIDRLSAYRQHYQQELEAYVQGMDTAALQKLIDRCLSDGGAHNGES